LAKAQQTLLKKGKKLVAAAEKMEAKGAQMVNQADENANA